MNQTQPNDVELLRVTTADHRSPFRLICFPSTRDSPAGYLALADLLLPTVEVLAVRYQEAAPSSAWTLNAEELASRCFEALSGWTDRPIALLGHRTGAYLAFQVAGRLERETGVRVAALFVMERNAPPATAGDPPLRGRIVAVAAGREAAGSGWPAYTTSGCVEEYLPPRTDHRRFGMSLANLIHDELLGFHGE
ncbi:thioesterase II family protein [Actinoplanes regularis]|uniref:Thioesterase domain-containing protein n=1 Tax=Actinoplanes regularis TaxID=52697 RepID=A0A239IMY9_9ACTN|nr:thioesterase domain-containing protein [Actinoplanes regularis]GIE91512.1 hypothetical protein Are01nite_79920 [Actinoplanes regularis]GLW33351.1 hypothetical protein Areg01_62890 [Actinoplanes regularis]SNS93774.1 Thioesterase domain-containing protein [Actinoplanes regularis]